MPPRFLVDPAGVDLDHVEADIEDIRKYNPQRFEMEQISAILRYDGEEGVCVALREVGEEEFWVRGHIPARPILPGVLMCECAAQVSSYYFMRKSGFDGFLGFAGLEKVKFRGVVVPGDRLVMVAKAREMRPRRAIFDCQGFVGERLVFHCVIIGMAV